MNEVMTAMYERRTIRKYTDQEVSEETLRELFKIIESTQSWANSQCWEVVEVRDSELRKALQSTVPTKNPAYTAIVNAPVLLAMCARRGQSGTLGTSEMATKHGDWYMYDLGLATQNLCLAAHSLGLGTVVVGWFDPDKAEGIVNAPEGVEVVSLIPLGYRNQKGVVPKHKLVENFVHVDTF
ncbi:MAG: nitroreductase family protein [Halodesulfovibrio sp.]|uniref:nitroreductase family protein n=1 Tax=Halodesulfovibrio sp. TaxID=1912772 RepID=UPI00359E732C